MSRLTVSQLYRVAKQQLAAVPVERPEREALLLCERFLGLESRADLALRGDAIPGDDCAEQLMRAVSQRGSRPLQYILGQWEFDSMPLAVGEGVLVPREDTLSLVELAAERLSGARSPLLLDLCAGSGAVGLAVARRFPGSRCVSVELSEEAWPFLTANLERFGGGAVSALRADVLDLPPAGLSGGFDAILSNPPYIPAGEIAGLSREVRQEPRMALDGGGDGLDFYRAICENWLPLLRAGGVLAVELGIGQYEPVERLFVRCGLADIGCKLDFCEVKRAIIGTKIEKK